jgi:hypothetical protein
LANRVYRLGVEDAMIDFSRSFRGAWERMHLVLFRPFDLGKWFAIGFSAFLAGLLEGGNGVNGSYNSPGNSSTSNEKMDPHEVMGKVSDFVTAHLTEIILISVVAVVVILGFTLLIYWLGSRGQFMFLDNIVRNRGAVAWTWSYYSRQANSVFGLYLLYFVGSMVILLPILIGVLVIGWRLVKDARVPDANEIAILGFLGLAYFGFAIVLFLMIFIFREFGIPIMFRQGILARPAFVQAMDLAAANPGSVAGFILLRIAIFIGVIVVSVLACCFTCCIATLPYLGTVILLPVWVFVKCFSLECLAQFGPQYNIWTVDALPSGQGIVSLSPPPPRE